MGSHYIPVGKIKIDKEILDIACPAAGYTPEILCPANGWVLEPGQPYVPVVDIGTPSVEQIFILLQHSAVARFTMAVTCAGSQWYWELYSGTGDFIEKSSNINSGNSSKYLYEGVENAFYIIKIKLVSDVSITKFLISQMTGYEITILEVKMNTPYIAELNNAFRYTPLLRVVEFVSSVEYLTTMQAAFQYSGIEFWKPSKNFASLTNMSAIFQYSNIQQADFSDSLFPVLENFSYGFSNTNNAYKVKFPSSFPELTNASYLFNTSNVKLIEMYSYAPKVTSYLYFAYNAIFLEGSIVFPEAQYCTTIYRIVENSKIESLTLLGNWLSLTDARNVCSSLSRLVYMEFPRQMGSLSSSFALTSTFVISVPELIELRLPDLIFFSTTLANLPFSGVSRKMKIIQGDMESGLGISLNFGTGNLNYSANLEEFELPKALYSRLYIGGSAVAKKLTNLSVDWANSPWEMIPTGSTNMTIRLWCALTTAALNNIYNELPTVVPDGGTYKLQVSSNPGFGGSNYAVVEAKGWTVI